MDWEESLRRKSLTEIKFIYSQGQLLSWSHAHELIPTQRIVLIVGLTVIVIVIVVVARVLTGRSWSNLSSPKPSDPTRSSRFELRHDGPKRVLAERSSIFVPVNRICTYSGADPGRATSVGPRVVPNRVLLWSGHFRFCQVRVRRDSNSRPSKAHSADGILSR